MNTRGRPRQRETREAFFEKACFIRQPTACSAGTRHCAQNDGSCARDRAMVRRARRLLTRCKLGPADEQSLQAQRGAHRPACRLQAQSTCRHRAAIGRGGPAAAALASEGRRPAALLPRRRGMLQRDPAMSAASRSVYRNNNALIFHVVHQLAFLADYRLPHRAGGGGPSRPLSFYVVKHPL